MMKYLIKFFGYTFIFLVLGYLISPVIVGFEKKLFSGLESNFVIGNECSGIWGISAFLGAVFAYKPQVNGKLFLSLFLLFFYNLLRLFLVLISRSEVVHFFSWFFTSVVIVGLWYWVVNDDRN